MPFFTVTLETPIPPDPRYPRTPKTIGDHIRTRRLDSNLSQKQAAKLLNIHYETIKYWELNKGNPRPEHYPAILSFLGYDPLPTPTNFAEKIKQYRLKNGLSQETFALQLSIQRTTVQDWELGKRLPRKRLRKRLKQLGLM